MANVTKFPFIAETNNLGDLTTKPTIQLKELLERQDHLLKNKSLINKLKDKGAKVKILREEIAKELASRNNENFASHTKIISSNSDCEWKTECSETKTEIVDNEETINPLEILSQNGQIPTKTHIKRLIDKEKDTGFSFKPYNTTVAQKIKDIKPNAHTEHSTEHSAKKIHLDESLNLLTEQLSALKVFCNENRSRRANECVTDILNETNEEEQDSQEMVDEFESKPGSSVNISIND